MALVTLEIHEQIGIITLNNPVKRNALSEELVEGIIQALRDCRNSKVPAVILRAAEGCGVWSAGHDVKELPHSKRDPLAGHCHGPRQRLGRSMRSGDELRSGGWR
jgi:methylmalonyl-CoA decarboxylase